MGIKNIIGISHNIITFVLMKGMLYKPLSDMESNGVDFDVDELLLVGDDSLCNYSGLPSVKSYDDTRVPEEDTFFLGHS